MKIIKYYINNILITKIIINNRVIFEIEESKNFIFILFNDLINPFVFIVSNEVGCNKFLEHLIISIKEGLEDIIKFYK